MVSAYAGELRPLKDKSSTRVLGQTMTDLSMPFFCTSILHDYGFHSIRILPSRGEILPNTGSAPGISTRRMFIRELPVRKMAAGKSVAGKWKGGSGEGGGGPSPRQASSKADFSPPLALPEEVCF